MKNNILDELNLDTTPTAEELLFYENRRKQHLHLIIAQLLGILAGIALVWAACKSSSDSTPMWEIAVYVLFFSFSFMVLFRLFLRVFQKLRFALGRRVYDAATGQEYIAPRNILAGFLSYVVSAPVVASASSYIGGMAQFALDTEGVTSVIFWIEAICPVIMLLLTTAYLLYRDIDYVRTAGVGSFFAKTVQKMYFITIAVLALIIIICVIL